MIGPVGRAASGVPYMGQEEDPRIQLPVSLPVLRTLLLSAAALVAAAGASAQARGAVAMSAYVLPSPALLSRNLPPSGATGHTVTASAEFGQGQPRISTVGRPRQVGRVGDQVEMSVILVVQSNVAYRILVEDTDAGTSITPSGLQVHDARGRFRALLNNGPVVAVEAAAAGSNRHAEIRYRVNSAAAAGQTVLPLRLTLQTSAML